MSEQALRVLLVDDEESLREPLAKYLRGEPYEYTVKPVPNGIEGLHLLEETQGRFDVALIDEVLEEGPGGLELLKHIKATYPDIEVILFTGWGLQSALEALRAGAYRYFAKPFNPEELALTIRFAAEQRRLRRERRLMEALVSASRELTRTTRQEEQLDLVWNFAREQLLREQLDSSTFYIALYYSESDTLAFPLVYDKGQRDALPNQILRSDRAQWGITDYVVKDGQEIAWSTLEQIEQFYQLQGIKPRRKGVPSHSGFCFPLQVGSETLGVLSVQSYQPYAFDPVVLDAVRALGNQVATALENGRLFTQAEQKARDAERQANNLKSLQNLALTISSSLESHEILTRTCQAAVELFKADHSGLVLFDDQFVQGRVEAEYPALRAIGITVPLRGVSGVENFIATRKPLIVNDVAVAESFGPVRDIWLGLGIRSIVIVPIISKDKLLGSFSLDAIQQPRPFSQEEAELCETFAAQVAVAIENARYIEAVHQKLKESETLYKVGKAITSTLDPDVVLKLIAEGAVDLVGPGVSASINLYNADADRFFARATAGPRAASLSVNLPRPNGVSRKALLERNPIIIPDAQNDLRTHPVARQEGVIGIVCAPIEEDGKPLGTLYIDSTIDSEFTKKSIALILSLANQAALAVVNARLYQETRRRMLELEHLHSAAKAMTSTAGIPEVLQEIVNRAQEVLEADYSFLWSYDRREKTFIPEEFVASQNVPEEWMKKFRKEPEAGRTTSHVLASGYVQVTDLSQATFIGESTRTFLEVLGVKSFQGIRLDVSDEPLGVLYVDYKAPREFGAEERRVLEHFANDAALTLKRARLDEQVRRSRQAARAVAKVSTLGKLEDTLKEIVNGARVTLHCDIATLYTFDEGAQCFVHVEGDGYKDKNNMRQPRDIAKDSALWKITSLADKDYHVAERADEDPILAGNFVHKEGIKSALGIRLRFGAQRVGVMFINYCNPHPSTQDEIDDALQFGNQAAVAIRNAQLHEETLKQYESLEQTKGALAARTSVAWIGMTSAAWRHAIEKHAITIREQIELLRNDLTKLPKTAAIGKRLEMIERLANQILEKPITPPLTAEEGAQSVPVNDLVRERTKQLWSAEPYRSVSLNLELRLEDDATTRASPDWLRRVLDVLIDNAVEATFGLSQRKISITTKRIGGQTEITISDSGKGIPEGIKSKLFKERIEKPKGSTGLGLGLLFAQTIAQTYGGEIEVGSTGPKGTSMIVSLPLEA